MTKILSTMTKNFMVFYGVFVCFAGIEAENRRTLIYRGPWILWPHKLLVHVVHTKGSYVEVFQI